MLILFNALSPHSRTQKVACLEAFLKMLVRNLFLNDFRLFGGSIRLQNGARKDTLKGGRKNKLKKGSKGPASVKQCLLNLQHGSLALVGMILAQIRTSQLDAHGSKKALFPCEMVGYITTLKFTYNTTSYHRRT